MLKMFIQYTILQDINKQKNPFTYEKENKLINSKIVLFIIIININWA